MFIVDCFLNSPVAGLSRDENNEHGESAILEVRGPSFSGNFYAYYAPINKN